MYQLINQDSYWESINSPDICNTCFMKKNILKWHGWAEKRLGDRTSDWDLTCFHIIIHSWYFR